MNRHPSADDPRLHAQIWELLPWLVNGSASDAQRALAAEHLAHCDDCRAELRAQEGLQQAVCTAPVPPAVDAEAGLARLLGRIAEPAASDLRLVAPAAPAAPRRRSQLVPALAAAVVVQAVGLGLLSLHALNAGKQADTAGYRTLSQGQPAAPMATLRVLPDAGMALAEWHALLQAQGLRVVDGPNAMGAYSLAPVAPASGPSAGASGSVPRDEQLARLRATAGIRLAEPLGPLP